MASMEEALTFAPLFIKYWTKCDTDDHERLLMTSREDITPPGKIRGFVSCQISL